METGGMDRSRLLSGTRDSPPGAMEDLEWSGDHPRPAPSSSGLETGQQSWNGTSRARFHCKAAWNLQTCSARDDRLYDACLWSCPRAWGALVSGEKELGAPQVAQTHTLQK